MTLLLLRTRTNQIGFILACVAILSLPAVAKNKDAKSQRAVTLTINGTRKNVPVDLTFREFPGGNGPLKFKSSKLVISLPWKKTIVMHSGSRAVLFIDDSSHDLSWSLNVDGRLAGRGNAHFFQVQLR